MTRGDEAIDRRPGALGAGDEGEGEADGQGDENGEGQQRPASLPDVRPAHSLAARIAPALNVSAERESRRPNPWPERREHGDARADEDGDRDQHHRESGHDVHTEAVGDRSPDQRAGDHPGDGTEDDSGEGDQQRLPRQRRRGVAGREAQGAGDGEILAPPPQCDCQLVQHGCASQDTQEPGEIRRNDADLAQPIDASGREHLGKSVLERSRPGGLAGGIVGHVGEHVGAEVAVVRGSAGADQRAATSEPSR